MDFTAITELVAKYKVLLLDHPEVFILGLALGWGFAWLVLREKIQTAKDRADFQKERAEHFKNRVDAADLQLLRTFSPPGFEKNEKQSKAD